MTLVRHGSVHDALVFSVLDSLSPTEYASARRARTHRSRLTPLVKVALAETPARSPA
jgi:hypothetical protein